MATKEQIEAVIKKVAPWFDADHEDARHLCWSTRENGSTYTETPGAIDIKAARAVIEAIKVEFPKVRADMDTCDEWTSVLVNL